MEEYFKKRKEVYDKGVEFLFKTPINEYVDPHIYEGEVDEEGYISWKPIEKHKNHDLTRLENQLGVVFHPSIKEYFNSYWFATLDGFIGNHYIKLEAVLPNIELDSFTYMVKGYKSNHNNKLDHIPLGIEGNGLIVVVDNQYGTVQLEDFERKSFDMLADNIASLISQLKLRK
ncbi:SecY-interacting protein Syd [Thermoactinomyces mirandus]|uniref:SecY-interacting protein Syd n=1 Tax=Thermoactinomyces mirandus TaxID=2756294 RepID=A0A7W1XR25_9BACL|nr:SecY-interacting protein Syd [Thermoactinomyces mirandus]MBA4601728.1 SecY-interacting protein Syd [Thermoactinomyces mirandus]